MGGQKRCSHGKRKDQCKECNPCPHGHVKQNCAACNPCPHGKLKGHCADCNPCPHGKVKSHCKDCTPHTVSSPSRASIVCFPFFARHETRCVRASAATANVGVVAFHQLFVCSEADAA